MTASPEERFAWLVTELWSNREQQVYAVLDGAQDRSVMPAVIHSGLPHECLFAGSLSSDLREAAPYLVQLEKGGNTTRNLLNMGWGRSYGIFAASPAPLEAMRRHFRRFLRVRTEDSTRLLFRNQCTVGPPLRCWTAVAQTAALRLGLALAMVSRSPSRLVPRPCLGEAGHSGRQPVRHRPEGIPVDRSVLHLDGTGR